MPPWQGRAPDRRDGSGSRWRDPALHSVHGSPRAEADHLARRGGPLTDTAGTTPAAAADRPDATSHATAALRTDDRAWDSFVAAVPTGTFQQTTAWPIARAGDWDGPAFRCVVDSVDGPFGAQVLTRRMSPGPWSSGWAVRGPVARRYTEAGVRAFTAELRQEARRRRLSHVFADPELPHDGPEGDLLEGAGWRPAPRMQPNRTRIVDLTPSEEQLWHGLTKTGRWSANKARRNGVTVEALGAEGLGDFSHLYTETASRVGFRRLSPYEDVFRAFHARDASTILIARDADGEPMATVMLIRCGDRVTELYGAASEAGLHRKASYLIKWEALLWSRRNGAAAYDLFGTDDPNYATFKAHFGGDERIYDGAYDLVTDRPAWLVLSTARRLRSLVSGDGRTSRSDARGR